jgi:TrmH family RNA methyltransferase
MAAGADGPCRCSFWGVGTVITSTSNARIKDARKLLRSRGRRDQGRLLIEGVRLIRDALAGGVIPEAVFYSPERAAANPAVQALADELAARGVDVQPCSEAVFATLSDTVTPQGIAAVCALPDVPLPSAPSLALILDGVRDPGNAGTLLRSAAAAGADCALFAADSVDPYNPKVVRAAMGTHFRLPIRVFANWQEAVTLLAVGANVYLADAVAAVNYTAVDWRVRCALVLGGEATGASAAARAAALPIGIPMAGGTESLNVAVAGSVILFEAARQRQVSKKIAGALPAR